MGHVYNLTIDKDLGPPADFGQSDLGRNALIIRNVHSRGNPTWSRGALGHSARSQTIRKVDHCQLTSANEIGLLIAHLDHFIVN